MKKTKDGLKIVNPDEYITENALESLGSAEGHWEGVTDPKTEREKKQKIFTTYYGVTKNGLDSLSRLKKRYKVYVPEHLLAHTVDTLNRKDAREIAKYLAVFNTFEFDDVSKSKNAFSSLPLGWRSALLTVYHTGGVRNLQGSYKDINAKGSLLKAIDSKNKEAIVRALISSSDGTVMENPGWSNPENVGNDSYNERDGRLNRYFLGIKLMYDQDFTLTPEDKDKKYDEWRKQKTTDKVVACLDSIDEANGKIFEQQQQICYKTTVFQDLPLGSSGEEELNKKEQKEPVQEQMPKENKQEESNIMNDLYNSFKNMLSGIVMGGNSLPNIIGRKTNKEAQNGTGNENNNLQ